MGALGYKHRSTGAEIFAVLKSFATAERSTTKNCSFVEGVSANRPSRLFLYLAGITEIHAKNTRNSETQNCVFSLLGGTYGCRDVD